MTKVFNKFVVALLVASFFVFPAIGATGEVQAQDAFPPELEPQLSEDGLTLYNGVTPLVIVADPNPEMQGLKAVGFTADDALADLGAATATFSISYVAAGGTDPWGETCQTFPAAAKTAFEAGAAIWATRLQSSVPVTIQACWADLGSPNTLGYSGGEPIHRNFTGAPKTNTWYFAALANSLAGFDLDPSSFDDYITYNSGFTWYYGTDGNPPAGQYDLVSVAAHEIGHGLNFAGSAGYSGGTGSLGQDGSPVVYDTFIEDGSGTAITSYTNPSTALGTLLTSNNLWFDGSNANAANGGTRVKMYAPSTWSGGSSYSHLDYTTFASTPNALMVYAIGDGTARHDPGPVTMGLLKDLGWGTSSGSIVPTPLSPAGTIIDRTPTYKWTPVTGATQYQYQLVKGSTTVYTKTVPASACTATACSNTPATALSFASYNWRARALVGGVWNSYSAYKAFKVVKGFDSQFNGNKTGWSAVKGVWTLSKGAFSTTGTPKNSWHSARHSDSYPTLTYEARLKRTVCPWCANHLAIRGTPLPLDRYGGWKNEYIFEYQNRSWDYPSMGAWSVFKIKNGKVTRLGGWTASSYINPYGWNTLKVTAKGSAMKFYINGHLVWSGRDIALKTGAVGVGMYQDYKSSTMGRLYVDWAKLSGVVGVTSMEEAIPSFGPGLGADLNGYFEE